jgi:hypothetical protein
MPLLSLKKMPIVACIAVCYLSSIPIRCSTPRRHRLNPLPQISRTASQLCLSDGWHAEHSRCGARAASSGEAEAEGSTSSPTWTEAALGAWRGGLVRGDDGLGAGRRSAASSGGLQVLGDGGLVRGELRGEGGKESGGGGHGKEPLRTAKSSVSTSKDATHAAETRSPWPPGRAAAAQQWRGRRLLRPLRRARSARAQVCLSWLCLSMSDTSLL